MKKTNSKNLVLTGAILLMCGGGAAHAAGPMGVGAMPFDGGAGPGSFTIDGPIFDASDLAAAPCPTGTTCTNMSGTDDDMLVREILLDGGARIIQQIIADLGGNQGDFILESNISPDGASDNNASKIVIDDVARDFFTTQAFYRGDVFDGATGGFNIAVEVHQDIDSGFQVFDMETEAAPNQQDQGGIATRSGGWFRIAQNAGQRAGSFLHVAMGGSNYTPIGGILGIDGDEITYNAGDLISATWIGQQMWNGGPGEGISDHRSADQTEFGLLIYRSGSTGNNNSNPIGGNAGGNGTTNDPMFTANVADGIALQEVRGFTLVPDQDSNDYLNVNHGSFSGGFNLQENWDEGLFGDGPGFFADPEV